jgi:hypothetical protein
MSSHKLTITIPVREKDDYPRIWEVYFSQLENVKASLATWTGASVIVLIDAPPPTFP